MRRIAACLVAMLASTVLVGDAAALSAFDASLSAAESMSRAVVDRLVFEVPLARFRVERSRAKRAQRWLITSTDGCSAPLVGSTGKSFDFRSACERHDFAYANYTALARLTRGVTWDSSLRARVDDQFQRDMQESCARRRHSERLRCDAWVVVFFHTVRVAAGP